MARLSGVASEFRLGLTKAARDRNHGYAYFEVDFRRYGVNPESPTEAKPGSPEKVAMLAARYAAGLPLWHDDDCYDHGPVLAEMAFP